MCAFYTLFGFVVISRYESMNEFLIPSIGVVTFLALPLLAYFGAVDRSLFYVHPIQPYLLLIRAGFVAVSNAEVIYAVTGSLVLLDERDDGVLSAILVTPVSSGAYFGYRIATPLAVGFVATMFTYPLARLTPLPVADLAPAVLLGSFGAPFMALYLASSAENKVTGFAMMKLMNAVQILPVAAYFMPMPVQLLIGVLPSYWPMKVVWLAAAGRPYGAYVAAGLVVNAIAVAALMKRFDHAMHR